MPPAVETLRHTSLPAHPEKVAVHLQSSQAGRKPPPLRAHELDLTTSTMRAAPRERRKSLCEKLSEADCRALYNRGDFVALSIIAGKDFAAYHPPLFEQSAREAGTPLAPVIKRRPNKPPNVTIALPAVDTQYVQAAWLADERLRPFLKKEVAEKLAQASEPQSPLATTVESPAKLSKIAHARQLFLKAQKTQTTEDFAAAMTTVDSSTAWTLYEEGFTTTLGRTVKAYGYTGGTKTIPHFAAAIKEAGTIGYAAVVKGVRRKSVKHYIPTQQVAAAGEIFNQTTSLDQYKIGYTRPKMPRAPRQEAKDRPAAKPVPRRQQSGAVAITLPAATIFEASPTTNGRPNPFAGMSDIPPATAPLMERQNGLAIPVRPTEMAGVAIPHVAVVTSEIVARAQAGDPEAFEVIFNHYQSAIYNFVYRLMGNREDAFDFTQNTFLRAHQGLPKIRGDLRVGPWLYRIATNVCLDELRHRKLVKWQPWEAFISVFHPSQVARDNPERDVLDRENQEEVQLILDRLHPKYRMCLILREYQDLSHDEIAEILNTTRAAVKSMLSRAREEFRQVYARIERQPAPVAR